MRRAAGQAVAEIAPEVTREPIPAAEPTQVDRRSEARADEETVALAVPTASFDADAMRSDVADATGTNGNKPVLLKRFDAKLSSKMVIDQSMLASSREQYRRLAAALHHAREASGISVSRTSDLCC